VVKTANRNHVKGSKVTHRREDEPSQELDANQVDEQQFLRAQERRLRKLLRSRGIIRGDPVPRGKTQPRRRWRKLS
jgi:hypothetical protein